MALVECEISDDAYIAVFDTDKCEFIVIDNPDYTPLIAHITPMSQLIQLISTWH